MKGGTTSWNWKPKIYISLYDRSFLIPENARIKCPVKCSAIPATVAFHLSFAEPEMWSFPANKPFDSAPLIQKSDLTLIIVFLK